MYDPNQPRIPEGHHGGGRWTRGGYGYLSDVGKLPPPASPTDGAPRAPDAWDGQPDDLYLLSDLDRLRPVRGDQYALAGRFKPPTRISLRDLLSYAGAALASAVAEFEAWSRRDNGDQQTVATFRARVFSTDESGLIILPEGIQTLDRQTVIDKHCPRLELIEQLLEQALEDHPQDDGESNSNYGIRIHKVLKWKINNNQGKKEFKGLKAELSVSADGKTVGLDVFEDLGDGRACVYDYKIGKFAKLEPGRMLEIANKTFAARKAPGEEIASTPIWRIVVTQVKPGQGKSTDQVR